MILKLLTGSLGAVMVIETTGVADLKIYPILIGLGVVVSKGKARTKLFGMRVFSS